MEKKTEHIESYVKNNRDVAIGILSNDDLGGDSDLPYEKEYRKELKLIADKEKKFNEDLEKSFQR